MSGHVHFFNLDRTFFMKDHDQHKPGGFVVE